MTKKSQKKTQSLKIPQYILIISKISSLISSKLATSFAARLFTTPIKHKIPARELDMELKSIQKKLWIPTIKKEIITYEYGKNESKRTVLLVHGWSGRGTQLFKIADELLANGFTTVSFDAPAHGKSAGKTTIMMDFIESILEIEKQYGPFEIAIGHSLGGMSVLNSVKKGLKVQKAVIIGSGDIVQDILEDFTSKIKLKPIYSQRLCDYFENKYKVKMNDFSAYVAAQEVKIPVLVIHDKNDHDVPVTAGIHIHKYLENSELVVTEGLGHRKILGDKDVIQKIINFIK
ncbi:alpha/beta hydrolase [Flavobacterium sp. Fl-77]|uniref:Alpha/beta hydrolase n=1 Tax=Flavobacterium flavipigmentatum TaxID=2893884 RepID=A0AAJ2S9G3_9FLAO|nr:MULTISPECIES: alpha/beta hydrolase [unclassified Flavobacterium]MDX6182808.1 alpha/beta hydrolase [Flavobacterium sp. Fl-33]MDX6186261.1 alpha/beta hydrolase [Flavobacterium sp. Fl-77]UFH37950.1 alpha/beta hydrolase [Flavobacterium sp. F-70]